VGNLVETLFLIVSTFAQSLVVVHTHPSSRVITYVYMLNCISGNFSSSCILKSTYFTFRIIPNRGPHILTLGGSSSGGMNYSFVAWTFFHAWVLLGEAIILVECLVFRFMYCYLLLGSSVLESLMATMPG
jgi:hypothetical protein